MFQTLQSLTGATFGMSTGKNPIQDILKTAIQREIDANTLYSRAAALVKRE